MEKLIELLNEYEAERHKTNIIPQIRKGEDRLSYLEMNWSYSELLCISKRYGFIKWLVDNDKIEASEIMLDDRMGTVYDKTDSTLMMLAIQDNPIEYLLSVIK